MTRSRREALTIVGGCAALSMVATGAGATLCHAAEQANADLLAACAEFHRLHAAVQAASDRAGLPDPDGRRWTELDAAMAARWAVSDRVETMPATTPAGRRAKARLALVLLAENQPTAPDRDVSFAWAALRDVAAAL